MNLLDTLFGATMSDKPTTPTADPIKDFAERWRSKLEAAREALEALASLRLPRPGSDSLPALQDLRRLYRLPADRPALLSALRRAGEELLLGITQTMAQVRTAADDLAHDTEAALLALAQQGHPHLVAVGDDRIARALVPFSTPSRGGSVRALLPERIEESHPARAWLCAIPLEERVVTAEWPRGVVPISSEWYDPPGPAWHLLTPEIARESAAFVAEDWRRYRAEQERQHAIRRAADRTPEEELRERVERTEAELASMRDQLARVQQERQADEPAPARKPRKAAS